MDLYSGIPWVPQVNPEGLPISREDTVAHAHDKVQETLETYRNDNNVALKKTKFNLQNKNKSSNIGFRQRSLKYAWFFGHESFICKTSPFLWITILCLYTLSLFTKQLKNKIHV